MKKYNNIKKQTIISFLLLIISGSLAAQYDEIARDKGGYRVVKTGNKYGVIDKSGNLIIPLEYSRVYSEFNPPVFQVVNEKGQGLMDTLGNILIDCQYNYFTRFGDVFIASSSKTGFKYGVFDRSGKKIHDFVYDDFDDGLLTIGEKYGEMDLTGKITIPVATYKKYQLDRKVIKHGIALLSIESSSNFSPVRFYKVGKGWLNDETYKSAYRFDEDGKAKIWGYGGKEGYLTTDGVEHWEKVDKIAKAKEKYTSIIYLGNKYSKVELDNKWGIVDNEMTELIPPIYSEIRTTNSDYVEIRKDGKVGLLDGNLAPFLPVTYEDIDVENGFFKCQLNSKYGLLNSAKKIIIPFKYDQVHDTHYELIAVDLNGKFGYYNKQGVNVIPPKYDNANYFKFGAAKVRIDGGDYHYIDKNGNTIKDFNGTNNIEMDFSICYAYGLKIDVVTYIGAMWNKKTGENRIFYTKDISSYDFEIKRNFQISEKQLEPLMDTRGSIMMKASGALSSSMGSLQSVLVWNTFTGRMAKFDYHNGFRRDESIPYDAVTYLRDNTEKGDILMDFEMDFLDRKIFTEYVAWNTSSGENTLGIVNLIPDYNAERDGDIMIDFDIQNAQFYMIYTTKSLKYALISSDKNSEYYNRKKTFMQTYLPFTPPNDESLNNPNFKVMFGLKDGRATNLERAAIMMIFDQNSFSNNLGLYSKSKLFYGQRKKGNISTTSYPEYKTNEQLGVCQLNNSGPQVDAYIIWNKNTGHFRFLMEKGVTQYSTLRSIDKNLIKSNIGKTTKP